MGCHPKPTKKQRIDRAIITFSEHQNYMPEIKIIPEQYNEIVTDTILDSSIRVRIKNYSHMNEAIVINKSEEKLEEQYRIISSDIQVYFNDNKTITATINANHISKEFKTDQFWDNANIQYSWLNQEQSTKDKVALNITLYNPLLDLHKSLTLTIDKQGIKTYSEETKFI
ncbi:MAG: hypothetical protein BM564_09355 [Bacteroidetes bacterium MedPE-SWsnd-G2]|nr:MAG: hypothetical protein BM564_09355 [Bacteroidetes bacterium MedPE-SWsnd-G2]